MGEARRTVFEEREGDTHNTHAYNTEALTWTREKPKIEKSVLWEDAWVDYDCLFAKLCVVSRRRHSFGVSYSALVFWRHVKLACQANMQPSP